MRYNRVVAILAVGLWVGACLTPLAAADKGAKELPRIRITVDETAGDPEAPKERKASTIDITLLEDDAPNTVANFIQLTEKKFYDGLLFHRVIPNFMIQGGDPEGTGRGGPGYTFADEPSPKVLRGSLAMANRGPNTNGSQFFICHKDCPWLDGKHTVFGKVTSGQDVVDRVKQGAKIVKIEVLQKRDHPYEVKKLER